MTVTVYVDFSGLAVYIKTPERLLIVRVHRVWLRPSSLLLSCLKHNCVTRRSPSIDLLLSL